ncbi:uncharacterized protein TM35_000022660 [Trypanosoma theileri]|uniref:Gamma tubulin complex component protein N-terminal domain-containing protein n=1 Tax=Trypanosoma theileri TaxID=67003 RepID=A0A1X0P903_9TRYP|nr:uncharacterized protein TM35_000022660 [Trypanosoma theileri]ORC92940.1 hypothetical protein TM35_000022660 [Trypanosoma theileri]
MASSAGTAIHRCGCSRSGINSGDGNCTLSLVELLLELSNSLTYHKSHSYSRGDHTGLSAEANLFTGFTAAAGGTTNTSNTNTNITTTTGRFQNPTKLRRKRRRDVINAFFDPTIKVSSSHNTRRQEMREMFLNAKENIRQVTETHAAMLELLCTAVAPDIINIENHTQALNVEKLNEDAVEMTEMELMLYIILRTSIAAAPTWQKPPIIPRCWLSPSITAIIERSPALQRTMRWSCDPDPVIDAALTSDAPGYNGFSFGVRTSYHIPSLLAYYMDNNNNNDTAAALTNTTNTNTNNYNYNNSIDSHSVRGAAWPQSTNSSSVYSIGGGICSYWSAQESMEVRHLFSRKRVEASPLKKKESEKEEEEEEEEEKSIVLSSSRTTTGTTTTTTKATSSRPIFSIFKEEYPSGLPFCSLLFVALHRGIVGQQDPYLLLRLEYENNESGSFSLNSLSSPNRLPYGFRRADGYNLFSGMQPIGIIVSPEFLVANGSKPKTNKGKHSNKNGIPVALREREKSEETHQDSHHYTRGVMTMLEWSCQSGTLFLRLQYLCEVSERAEWRASLGQYGKSAIEALRRVLLLLLRRVSDLSNRPGGPHCVTFRELLEAQQHLRCIAEDIMALSDVFLVNAEMGWTPSTVLSELSSATLLSSLYTRYTQRIVNHTSLIYDKGERLDVIGELFLAVLNPLHHMMCVWLRRGELQDPYDEFFIMPSYGTTDCGFLVETSPQRLPSFISLEAAENILHAGVSLRVLRAAARHVTFCAKKDQLRLKNETEDVDAAAALHDQMDDAMEINWLLSDFMNALLESHTLPLSKSSSSSLSLLGFPQSPEVDLLQEEGTLSYWRDFYGACNRLLLSAGEEEEEEQQEDDNDNDNDDEQQEQEEEKNKKRETTLTTVMMLEQGGVHQACDPLSLSLAPDTMGSLEDGEDSMRKNNTPTGESGEIIIVTTTTTTTTTAASPLSTTVAVTPTVTLSALGGKTKYGSTTFSRASRATTAWHEAISEELAQVAQVTNEEEAAKLKTRTALRLEYERHVLRKKAQRQLQQWKARRLSLNLERAAAISRCVDDLQELYLHTLKPSTEIKQDSHKGDNEEEEKEKVENEIDDGRRTPIGKFVIPLKQLPSITPCTEKNTVVGRAKFTLPRIGIMSEGLYEDNEDVPNTTPLSSRSRFISQYQQHQQHQQQQYRRANMSRTLNSSLQLNSSCKDVNTPVEVPCEFKHTPEMYVVADINDEEYLMKRAGPHVSDVNEMEAVLAKMDIQEASVRGSNVSSEAYQKRCIALAREALYSMGEAVEVIDDDDDDDDDDKKSNHNNKNNHNKDKKNTNKIISNVWWTDPTTDEEVLKSYKDNSITSGKTPAVTINMTDQQIKTLLHCSSYYLRLGHYTASYLTHKALQVMLLGPYGTLYRLMQQLLDVCLMQRGSVAARLTGLWERLTKESMEENTFSASSTFMILNRAFVEEWESSVLYGGDTLMHIQLALSLPDGDSENEESMRDGVYLMGDEMQSNISVGVGVNSSGFLFSDTAFRRRRKRSPSMCGVGIAGDDENEEEELREYWNIKRKQQNQEEEEEEEEEEEHGTKKKQHAFTLSLPDNPFDFISQLTIVHNTPREDFWLLPKNAIAIYGDLFSTLLFWTSVMQLVTRVWFIGIKSGVSEAFFFCNVTRAVFGAVAQHMWFLIAGYARAYRESLRFESGVLYGYQQLENFSRDHAVFLEHCRFAAMLTPAFARARQQVYGMVRQLEEVEQYMLAAERSERETSSVRISTGTASRKRTSEHIIIDDDDDDDDDDDNDDKKKTKKKKNTTTTKTKSKANTKQEEEKGNSKNIININNSITSNKKKTSKKTGVVQSEMRSSGGSSSKEVVTKQQKREKSQQLQSKQQQQQAEMIKRKEERHRHVRDVLQRRLRSFLGLTEIFIEHLTAVRDSDILNDTEELFPQQQSHQSHQQQQHCVDEEEMFNTHSGRVRTSAAAAALTSLIRTLEMTKIAIHDKL